MILFHHIVEITNRSAAAAPAEFSGPLQFLDDFRIGRIPVHVDNSWARVVWRSQGFLKEAFGSVGVAFGGLWSGPVISYERAGSRLCHHWNLQLYIDMSTCRQREGTFHQRARIRLSFAVEADNAD